MRPGETSTESESGSTKPADLTGLTATALACGVNAGVLDPHAIVQAFMSRLEAVNPAVNAMLPWSREDLLRQADVLARRLAAGERPPLAGVPVAVKNNIWVAGWRVTQGARLFADFIAPADALAVARLRQAGAIILGLSNCPEFACRGVTTNVLHGTTRNPWDLERTPGGSSGGSASAVAAGLCPVALGTDAGGSIRRPAAHTGIVGFMPSAGLVPHPLGFTDPAFGNSAVGVLARDVGDVDRVMTVLGRPDPGAPPSGHGRGYAGMLTDAAMHTSLRIGFSPDLGLGVRVDPGVAASVAQAVQALAGSGAQVIPVTPSWPEGTCEARIEALEQSALAALFGDHYRREPSLFDPDVGLQIQAGLGLGGREVARALFFREALGVAFARCFREIDVLLCPTAPVTAWPLANAWPPLIDGAEAAPRDHAVFTWLLNQVFAPACSVPCGLDEAGLPVGLQITAPPFQDAKVLRVAHALQQLLGAPFERPVTPAASLWG